MTISNSDLSDVMQPVARAKGLPNAHYIDPAAFDEERKSVLFANWSGVGFAKDVPNEGDAMPVDFLGVPLLILRDHDGARFLRRAIMQVLRATFAAQCRKFCLVRCRCFTVKPPHVGGPGQNIHADIKRNELGLFEMRSHVWLGVVFVNVSATAPDFDVVHADLIARWNEFDKPLYHSGADSSFKLDVACNWKLAVENYCESYHLPWVHPGLNSYSRLEDHYNIEENGRYSGQGTLVYRQLQDENGKVFPDFEGVSDKWDTGAEYITVFPNVLLGVHRDHTFAIVLEPKELGKTCEHVEIFYASEDAIGDGFSATRAKNTAQWEEVFKEDIFVVEGMQRGRLGPLFDGGKFSPAMDGATHVFHEWVAQSLSAGRQIAAE